MNLNLFLSGVFFFTFLLGKVIEKIRIPWVFSALFLGVVLSFENPFVEYTSSETFIFLAQLGMNFLLFIIGFDLNIREILKQGKFVVKLSLALVLSETILGSFFVHYLFDTSWGIALLVSSSFSTVGEAVLLPILDEFKIVKTKFGQLLLGVGVLDDVFELVTVIFASVVLGYTGISSHSVWVSFFAFLVLFSLPFLLFVLRKRTFHFRFQKVPVMFLFSLFMIFLFLGIGDFVEAASLGALFAGIALKELLSNSQEKKIELIVRNLAYGFLVPIFFLWVGVSVDIYYLFEFPLLVLLLVLLTKSTKICSSCIIAKNKMGIKKSILMGIGLSAKFSTSIVIVTLLFEHSLISSDLYSVLVGAMIVSKFIIPVLFSFLLKVWNLEFSFVDSRKKNF